MNTHSGRERGNTILWVLGVIALGVIAYFIFRTPKAEPMPLGQVEGVTKEEKLVLEGDVVCLPHRDTSGPTTMECAYGLKTATGEYYGLDTSTLPATTPPEYQVGDHLSVEGKLVPADQVPANFLTTYNAVGIVAMDAFWKFTQK